MWRLRTLLCTAASLSVVFGALLRSVSALGVHPAFKGYDKFLYAGHSFGLPFAQKLKSFTEMVGINNHVTNIVFRGGINGSPKSLWDDEEAKKEVTDILDTE